MSSCSSKISPSSVLWSLRQTYNYVSASSRRSTPAGNIVNQLKVIRAQKWNEVKLWGGKRRSGLCWSFFPLCVMSRLGPAWKLSSPTVFILAVLSMCSSFSSSALLALQNELFSFSALTGCCEAVIRLLVVFIHDELHPHRKWRLFIFNASLKVKATPCNLSWAMLPDQADGFQP